MKSITPKDQNACFHAPPNSNGEVFDLPGVNCRVGDKGSAFYSLWMPNPAELKLLNEGHPVMAGIANDGHPIHPIIIVVAARKDRVVDRPTKEEEGEANAALPTMPQPTPPPYDDGSSDPDWRDFEPPVGGVTEAAYTAGIPSQKDAKGDEPFISSGEYTDPSDPAFKEQG